LALVSAKSNSATQQSELHQELVGDAVATPEQSPIPAENDKVTVSDVPETPNEK